MIRAHHIADRTRDWNDRVARALPHEVAHLEQKPSTQLPPRMMPCEIFFGDVLELHQGNGKTVPDSQGNGRTCGRRQVERTGFLRNGQSKHKIRKTRHRGIRTGGHRNDSRALGPHRTQQRVQLGGFSALADGDQHVVAANHTHIAVQAIAGVKEHGTRPRTPKRRRDFPRNDPGLAHARHEHLAAAVRNEFNRLGERRRDLFPGGPQPRDLDIENVCYLFNDVHDDTQ